MSFNGLQIQLHKKWPQQLDRFFSRNSSLQAVCELCVIVSIARTTGCAVYIVVYKTVFVQNELATYEYANNIQKG